MKPFSQSTRWQSLKVYNNISPLTITGRHCAWVRVCVRAREHLLFCVNICYQVANFWENQLHKFENFQLNGASRVFLPLDLDLHIQGQIFDILFVLRISRTWWEIEQTLLLSSDRKSCICHRMAPVRMLYIITLTYISQGHEFLTRENGDS